MKIGWRKMTAWFLVFGLVAVASLVVKVDIPENNMNILIWVTNGFFLTNVAKPGVEALVKRKKEE